MQCYAQTTVISGPLIRQYGDKKRMLGNLYIQKELKVICNGKMTLPKIIAYR